MPFVAVSSRTTVLTRCCNFKPSSGSSSPASGTKEQRPHCLVVAKTPACCFCIVRTLKCSLSGPNCAATFATSAGIPTRLLAALPVVLAQVSLHM
jgi:hypothetical protein